jgi:hypothetical protein
MARSLSHMKKPASDRAVAGLPRSRVTPAFYHLGTIKSRPLNSSTATQTAEPINEKPIMPGR